MSHEKNHVPRATLQIVTALAVLLIFSPSCGQEQQTSKPAEDERTEALEHMRLPMGFIPNVQFAPFYVALERGYFTDEGIELEFDYSFETQGVQLVAAGELPFAVASGDQVILARAQGLPVVYVTEWWQRFPVAVASLAETEIETPYDLIGRTVGVPELFGASYIGWRALLSASGLDPSQVQLETIGYSQVPSLSEGRVEAAVVYANNEPVLMTSEGLETNVIAVADFADIVSNGLVTSENVISERPELVRSFVRAFLRGLADTLADPDTAFEISTRHVEGLKENTDFGRAVLEASLAYWQSDQLGLSQAITWEQSQDVMREAGLLEETVPVDELFTNEFLTQP